MSKLKVLARVINYNLLNLLNFFTYKYKHKIFIYDSTFRKDNLWALYTYLINEKINNKYTIIYYTKELKKVSMINEVNVKFIGSNLLGLYHQLTSKYVFWAFGIYKFSCKPKNGQVIINLWHGSPLKTIGYLNNERPWYKYSDIFTYTLCESEFFEKYMQKAFGFTNNQALITGSPRNDLLFNNISDFSKLGFERGNSKVILWMPTFRNSEMRESVDSNIDFPLLNTENIKKLDNHLTENNQIMLIKLHPYQKKLPFLMESFNNIFIITNKELELKEIELYELLGQADVLLTDYSSVYFDFLLTLKPIGFIIDDLDSYKSNRGFIVKNPLDLMPGEKIESFEDLLFFLGELSNGRDDYCEARIKLNDKANKYHDGNNRKRLIEFLGIK